MRKQSTASTVNPAETRRTSRRKQGSPKEKVAPLQSTWPTEEELEAVNLKPFTKDMTGAKVIHVIPLDPSRIIRAVAEK